MVWAGIYAFRNKRTNCIIMERDPTSKRNGFSTVSYLKVLEKELVP